MNLAESIRGLTTDHLTVAVLVFCCILAPGFLTIYEFRPDLIVGLETFKLLIFSLSIGTPLTALNCILGVATQPDMNRVRVEQEGLLALGAGFTACTLFPILALVHLFHFKFPAFLAMVAAVEVAFFGLCILARRGNKALQSKQRG